MLEKAGGWWIYWEFIGFIPRETCSSNAGTWEDVEGELQYLIVSTTELFVCCIINHLTSCYNWFEITCNRQKWCSWMGEGVKTFKLSKFHKQSSLEGWVLMKGLMPKGWLISCIVDLINHGKPSACILQVQTKSHAVRCWYSCLLCSLEVCPILPRKNEPPFAQCFCCYTFNLSINRKVARTLNVQLVAASPIETPNSTLFCLVVSKLQGSLKRRNKAWTSTTHDLSPIGEIGRFSVSPVWSCGDGDLRR